MSKFLARPTTLGLANTPVSVASLIAALSPAWPNSTAFSQLIIVNTGAGNLAVADYSSGFDTEAEGVGIPDQLNLGPEMLSNASEIYLLSATASKTLGLIGRTKF